MAPYASDDRLKEFTPHRTSRLRALVVFPLLAPLMIDAVAAGASGILGLFGAGLPGLLYSIALFFFWLPFCYALLAPVFLTIGAASLLIDRYVGLYGLRSRTAAAAAVGAIAATLWLAMRLLGIAEGHGSFDIDVSSVIAVLILIALATVGCWWVEPWIESRVTSRGPPTRRARTPT